MEIILLTPEQDRLGESDALNQMFGLGLERLHLRKMSYTANDYRKYFKSIREEYHQRIVLHGGGFELVNEINVGGIHLNSLQRNDINFLNGLLKRDKLMLSSSFHRWSEITATQVEFSYAFISPVFDSISKTNYKAAVELSGINAVKKYYSDRQMTGPKIVGLGGIDVPQMYILKQYNFDAVAVYGSIWKAPNAVTALESMLTFSK